jgi:predicted nucleic acid-binding protein
MRHVVSDTGPLLHLSEIQSGDLLLCFGSVQATPVVLDEFGRHWPGFDGADLPPWLTAASVSKEAADHANRWLKGGLLDAGEAEALAYAKIENADLFLTDDAAARTLAESIGVEARGTLGVILFAAAVGRLDEAEAHRMLDELENRSTLWMSSRVKQAAREAIAAIFA